MKVWQPKLAVFKIIAQTRISMPANDVIARGFARNIFYVEGYLILPLFIVISAYRMWFSVVCSLIDKEYASSQWLSCGLTRRSLDIKL